MVLVTLLSALSCLLGQTGCASVQEALLQTVALISVTALLRGLLAPLGDSRAGGGCSQEPEEAAGRRGDMQEGIQKASPRFYPSSR